LLTRFSTQSVPAKSVYIREALHPDHAGALLDLLPQGRPLAPEVRRTVLELLEGQPLALNWAGNLLAADEEDPASLASDWKSKTLAGLNGPKQTEHTLRWLFERSIRGLDQSARQALAAAGLLARAPFPLAVVAAGLGGVDVARADTKVPTEALKSLVRRGLLRRAAEKDHWEFTHVLGYHFARDEDGSDTGLRQRLGGWLYEDLMVALRGGDAGTLRWAGNLLQHGAALLRADFDQTLWAPLAEGFLYQVSDRLQERGRLDLVTRALL
jgi:hypothetical protein